MKSTASGSATRLVSAAWIATRSANDPGPVNPGWVWSGHTWVSPARQYSHRPQPQANGTVTRSPAPPGRPDADDHATLRAVRLGGVGQLRPDPVLPVHHRPHAPLLVLPATPG